MDECFNYVRQIIPEMESHFITPIPSQPVPTFLAHMDGTEGSTTFLDSADSHVITVMGNTHVDATPYIGIRDGGTFSLNGWIDELRIIKGTAYWTSDFTPPTAPYYPP